MSQRNNLIISALMILFVFTVFLILNFTVVSSKSEERPHERERGIPEIEKPELPEPLYEPSGSISEIDEAAIILYRDGSLIRHELNSGAESIMLDTKKFLEFMDSPYEEESIDFNIEFGNLSLSPDGECIAFWATDGGYVTYVLAGIEGREIVWLKDLTFYLGDYFYEAGLFPVYSKPIWSDDGKTLYTQMVYFDDKYCDCSECEEQKDEDYVLEEPDLIPVVMAIDMSTGEMSKAIEDAYFPAYIDDEREVFLRCDLLNTPDRLMKYGPVGVAILSEKEESRIEGHFYEIFSSGDADQFWSVETQEGDSFELILLDISNGKKTTVAETGSDEIFKHVDELEGRGIAVTASGDFRMITEAVTERIGLLRRNESGGYDLESTGIIGRWPIWAPK